MIIELYEVPPSINGFYRHNKFGTYITAKGREFKNYVEEYLKMLIEEGELTSFGDKRLRVEYTFCFKGKRKRDTGNYEKALSDCLEGILFDNDEQLDELNLRRLYHAPENKTIIKIYEKEKSI